MNKRVGFISLLATSFLYSTYGVFTRILNEELTVFQQLSYRYAIGLVFALVLILFIQKKRIDIKKFTNAQVLLFGLAISFSFYLFIRSLLESKLSVAMSGFYAGILLSAFIIGYFILKEKLSWKGIVGTILVFVSFIFLNNLNFTEIVNMGVVFGLFAGLGYGVGNYFKKVLKEFTKEEMLVMISFFIFLTMQTLSMISGEKTNLDLSFLTYVALFGFVIVALLSEYLTVQGFRNFDLYLGSIILSMEIFFVILVGYFIFDEIPTKHEWVGIMLIFVAVVISNLPEKVKLRG